MGCDGLVVSGLLSHNPGIDAARVEPQFDQFDFERHAMKATPLGVGSSLYPITDTTADSLCDKVDDGDRQWKELVGTFLDNVGIMDAQISQPNQCSQIYGTGLCKCDLPLADRESIKHHKRTLWALARLARSAENADIKPMVPLLLFSLRARGINAGANESPPTKLLLLVFCLFGPVTQTFFECRAHGGAVQVGSEVEVPLSILAIVDEISVSMWMHSHHTTFDISKISYHFKSLHELVVDSVVDITDQIAELRSGTRLDDELALLRKLLQKVSKQATSRQNAKGPHGRAGGAAKSRARDSGYHDFGKHAPNCIPLRVAHVA